MKAMTIVGALISIAVIGLILFVWSGFPRVSKQGIDADLAFLYRCPGVSGPPADATIGAFLHAQGFRVLNKVSLAKAQHVDYFRTMDIVALDDRHRQIDFGDFPGNPGVYTVSLYSPPPTHHDSGLEQSLVDFVSTQLQCKPSQIEHHENSQDTLEIYNNLFGLAEGWFKEADEMQRSPQLK